tara:strand:+ start:2281 stop:2529 length:249 start_codon:yes stop_codon:yes gene_type:complete
VREKCNEIQSDRFENYIIRYNLTAGENNLELCSKNEEGKDEDIMSEEDTLGVSIGSSISETDEMFVRYLDPLLLRTAQSSLG